MEVPKVYYTPGKGTPYFREPGVVLIAATELVGQFWPKLRGFLTGFNEELQFADYASTDEVALRSGQEQLSKFAGQLCYLSFGPKRTKNEEAAKYFSNILYSGHGSVLEHSSASFLFYGVSRSFTHELVRHRAGFAYSQVSQRYVDGKKLRFVMRPEYQKDPILEERFYRSINLAVDEYERRADRMLLAIKDYQTKDKTQLRKAVNQAARSCLPNETEAPIVATANLRAWRHFLTMRGGQAAEPEIRRVALTVCEELEKLCPNILQDVLKLHNSDIGDWIEFTYPKV